MRSLKIGVSGVRGVVGESLTPQLLVRFAQAFGTYIGPGKIVVGRDTRTSGEMVREALVGGLRACGCNVVDIGVAPVPTAQLAVRDLRADGGVAITASHNPAEWNAFKFIRGDGVFLNSHQTEELFEVYRQGEYALADVHRLGRLHYDDAAIERHIAKVLALVDVAEIRRARFKVVIDCCNGAGSEATPELLNSLGCRVVRLNTKPDGRFPHPPEPIPANLGQLCEAVRANDADIGFAQDADADRLAIVSDKGRAIGEEYTLALAALFYVERTTEPGPLVANLSTSRMVDDIADRFGRPVIRTPIGEVNVAEAMLRARAVIGGEGNGGVMVPRVHYGRDSLAGICLVLEGLARHRMSVSRIISKRAGLLPKYHICKDKVTVPARDIVRVMTAFARAHETERLNLEDGVKIDWEDSWLHVRPSNTEPISRVIAEASTMARAREIVTQSNQIIARELAR
ncbi:MAG: phosphoglucosamine mutase [Armatimonadota bacterium]